ncbi:hypothetical protein [Aestuariibacter salexigens]|uniref:hypothetical protein n=1 Tax=Aestuariibacter salexigens TaxID=226010 RepID=UPI00042878B7|nr:hypothetical protein [Aestuariibacter salexigens]
MQQLFSTLTDNMQTIYRKSIDADAAIEQLQRTGKGKFKVIFSEDAGFTTQAKQFKPYVEELAMEVASLSTQPEQDVKEKLPALVKKIELMLRTLAQFDEVVKQQ